jgi:hypothetical protein
VDVRDHVVEAAARRDHVVEATGLDQVVEATGGDHVVEATGRDHVVEALLRDQVVEALAWVAVMAAGRTAVKMIPPPLPREWDDAVATVGCGRDFALTRAILQNGIGRETHQLGWRDT